jgi:hypothetical protein
MIYFVQAVDPKRKDNSPVKIGYTSNPDLRERMYDLQVANPYPLRVLGVIAGGTEAQEGMIHTVFADRKLEGEWFSPRNNHKGHGLLRAFITRHAAGYMWGTNKPKPLPQWMYPAQ